MKEYAIYLLDKNTTAYTKADNEQEVIETLIERGITEFDLYECVGKYREDIKVKNIMEEAQ